MRSETVMTKALQDAFKEAEKLSDDEQERLAAAIHAEIDAEPVWASKPAASSSALAAIADETLAEHRAGRTLPLELDEP